MTLLMILSCCYIYTYYVVQGKLAAIKFRAKLYPTERRVRSCKCEVRRCQVCLNVTETEMFTSTVKFI